MGPNPLEEIGQPVEHRLGLAELFGQRITTPNRLSALIEQSFAGGELLRFGDLRLKVDRHLIEPLPAILGGDDLRELGVIRLRLKGQGAEASPEAGNFVLGRTGAGRQLGLMAPKAGENRNSARRRL